jgi:hypothetical protein
MRREKRVEKTGALMPNPSSLSCSKPPETELNQALLGKWGYIGWTLKETYWFNENGSFLHLYAKNGSFIKGNSASSGCYEVIGNEIRFYDRIASWTCIDSSCNSYPSYKDKPEEDKTRAFEFREGPALLSSFFASLSFALFVRFQPVFCAVIFMSPLRHIARLTAQRHE